MFLLHPQPRGTVELFSGSSQHLTELIFSSLRNIPAREEPHSVLGLAQLE